jgi:hypothetical protein
LFKNPDLRLNFVLFNVVLIEILKINLNKLTLLENSWKMDSFRPILPHQAEKICPATPTTANQPVDPKQPAKQFFENYAIERSDPDWPNDDDTVFRAIKGIITRLFSVSRIAKHQPSDWKVEQLTRSLMTEGFFPA